MHIQRDSDLYLTAAHNIPPQAAAAVTHVPHGKGMAEGRIDEEDPGSNLQSADRFRPRHQAGSEGRERFGRHRRAVLDRDGEVRAVVGIAWNKEGEIGLAEELSLMKRIANLPQ